MDAPPSFPEARSVALPTGVSLAVHELGQGPAVVLCHGFPELAYSWRHQLPALAAAGFRAIAPDQRGYGGSSRPEPVEAYGLTELCADLVALLDALEIERAVFVGHDWGGFVAWAMPVLHPERCAGVVGVCTPYVAMPATSVMSALVGGEAERLYVLWFQEPGVAESVLDRQVPLLFDRLMRRPLPPARLVSQALVDGKLDLNPFRRLPELEPASEPLLGPEEMAVYVESFERSGLRGGINWYRNVDRNAREHPEVGSRKLELPCLMLCAEWDMALRPEMAASMPARCADLEMHTLAQAGHWVQQEQPEAVNALLCEWLTRRFAP